MRTKKKRVNSDIRCVEDLDASGYETYCTRIQDNSELIPATGCRIWSKPYKMQIGPMMHFCGSSRLVHNVVLELSRLQTMPTGMIARHKCRTKFCVEETHLELGSHKQNCNDKIRDGTLLVGEKHPNAKITADKARAVASYPKGTPTQKIVDETGVLFTSVKNIRCGNVWSHVTGVRKRSQSTRVVHDSLPESYFAKATSRLYTKCKVWIDNQGEEHWLWSGKLLESGHAHFNAFTFNGQTMAPHRAAALIHHQRSSAPWQLQARHAQYCPANFCNPKHLQLGTALQNAADKVRDGTTPLGERNGRCTITKDVALQIKQSKGCGTQVQRAQQFGVTKHIVINIDRGQAWKHV